MDPLETCYEGLKFQTQMRRNPLIQSTVYSRTSWSFLETCGLRFSPKEKTANLIVSTGYSRTSWSFLETCHEGLKLPKVEENHEPSAYTVGSFANPTLDFSGGGRPALGIANSAASARTQG